ncbi:MAG: hypothetical protein LBR10_11440 [Prevotellaceae bacterium]|nr:hypothetical protein [Prevotellaceae bacterium]
MRRYGFRLRRSNDATPNGSLLSLGVAMPEGLDFHNRRSSTCGNVLSHHCLKGRTNYYYFNLRVSPAFDYVSPAFQAVVREVTSAGR